MAHAKIPGIYLVWPHGPKASLSTGRWRFDGKGVDADTDTDKCSRLICFECTFCADRRLSKALRSRLISMHVYMCDHLLRLIPRLWSARFRALISHEVDERSTHPLLPLSISCPKRSPTIPPTHTHTQGEVISLNLRTRLKFCGAVCACCSKL